MRMFPWGVEKSRKWCSEIHRFKNEQQAGGKERGEKGEKEKKKVGRKDFKRRKNWNKIAEKDQT